MEKWKKTPTFSMIVTVFRTKEFNNIPFLRFQQNLCDIFVRSTMHLDLDLQYVTEFYDLSRNQSSNLSIRRLSHYIIILVAMMIVFILTYFPWILFFLSLFFIVVFFFTFSYLFTENFVYIGLLLQSQFLIWLELYILCFKIVTICNDHAWSGDTFMAKVLNMNNFHKSNVSMYAVYYREDKRLISSNKCKERIEEYRFYIW